MKQVTQGLPSDETQTPQMGKDGLFIVQLIKKKERERWHYITYECTTLPLYKSQNSYQNTSTIWAGIKCHCEISYE